MIQVIQANQDEIWFFFKYEFFYIFFYIYIF
jgi:hypothetical protein